MKFHLPDSSDRCAVCGLSSESEAEAMISGTTNIFGVIICPEYKMFSCCNGGGNAVWNTKNSTWNCSDCGATQSNDANYIGNSFTNINSAYPFTKKTTKKCTCGSTICGSDRHSSWCDCYQK